MPGTVIRVLVARGRPRAAAPAARRARGDEDGDAAGLALRGRRARRARRRGRPGRRRRTCSWSSRTSERAARAARRAGAFLDAAGPLLLADEPRNNLILGIAGTLARAIPTAYAEKRFWLVTDDGRRAGRRGDADAAVQPPARGARAGAASRRWWTGSTTSCPAWSARTPRSTSSSGSGDGRTAVARAPRPGRLRARAVQSVRSRRAGHASTPRRRRAPRLVLAFGEEAARGGRPGRAEAAVDRPPPRDGGIRSLGGRREHRSRSGWGGPTPNGIRIGPAYTPPELRGAAMPPRSSPSSRRSADGRRFCFPSPTSLIPTRTRSTSGSATSSRRVAMVAF